VHLCCGESSSAALGRSPLGLWWLDPAAVDALSLTLIAAVYVGFAVADGRSVVLAVESGVAGVFVVLSAAAVTGSAWLLVLGFTGHGLKDLCKSAATMSPIHAGGRRSASTSTWSPQRSSSC
jgi:hypothetical protein